jgi:hypothetical protein
MRACVLASLAVASQAFVAPTSHVPRSSNGVVALRAVGRRPEASVSKQMLVFKCESCSHLVDETITGPH